MSTEAIPANETLYNLRTSRGLKHQHVVAGIAQATGSPPKHWTASALYERRGVRNIEVLEALAVFYNLPLDRVRAAARNSQLLGIPQEARRRSSPRASPVVQIL